MRVLIFVLICQFQTTDDMKDVIDLKINFTEKLLTPVLTKFALKYKTMALLCNRDFLKRSWSTYVCGQTYIRSHFLYIT